jgi:hypothetical protein
MDLALAGVTETLASEFAELRGSTVLAVVTERLRAIPHADATLVEQAARARLLFLRQQQRRRRRVAGPVRSTGPVAG